MCYCTHSIGTGVHWLSGNGIYLISPKFHLNYKDQSSFIACPAKMCDSFQTVWQEVLQSALQMVLLFTLSGFFSIFFSFFFHKNALAQSFLENERGNPSDLQQCTVPLGS